MESGETQRGVPYLCGLCGYLGRSPELSACAACAATGDHLALLDEARAAALSPSLARFLEWDADALAILDRVPEGFVRDLVRRRVEKRAREQGRTAVDRADIETKLGQWSTASVSLTPSLAWEPDAWTRISRVPDSVRGMVIVEVEREARRRGDTSVTAAAIDAAVQRWSAARVFHSAG
ncbi:MAG: PCP reductase family protein [Myxococcales bacterium]|nr:PCP reductase family protein [Myxococcales bacterium]